MANFIKHIPCDQCDSSDANALYDDKSTYCFNCKGYTKGTQSAKEQPINLTTSVELQRLIRDWSAAQPKSIPNRALNASFVKQYGVIVNDDTHAYPYFDDSSAEPIGFKVRTVSTKGFRVVGDIKSAGLFGQQQYGNHKRNRIVVCEGELDAIAARQMFQGKTPVVSLKGGAAAAARDFKSAYTFLDGFEEIVLCFDADEAGKAGVEKAAEVFAGKLRVMKLEPKTGKDAFDYLKVGRA